MAAIDLDAYCNRIGYSGPRAPTVEVLAEIQRRHTQTIAFENLDPLLRRPVKLDVESLQQKLVHGGRGGYCFEQNLLLSQILQALGFSVVGLAARILWNIPDGVVMPRGHMLLCVDVDAQRYIVDVGFGILTPTGPLRLEPDVEQATPHEPFRLRRDGEEFISQAQVLGKWRAIYRFNLQRQLLPDYEVMNWYLSNHPESRFVNGLIAARPDENRRYTLNNNEFTQRMLNGETEKRVLTCVAELRDVLTDVFRLTLPEIPTLDATFEKLF